MAQLDPIYVGMKGKKTFLHQLPGEFVKSRDTFYVFGMKRSNSRFKYWLHIDRELEGNDFPMLGTICAMSYGIYLPNKSILFNAARWSAEAFGCIRDSSKTILIRDTFPFQYID